MRADVAPTVAAVTSAKICRRILLSGCGDGGRHGHGRIGVLLWWLVRARRSSVHHLRFLRRSSSVAAAFLKSVRRTLSLRRPFQRGSPPLSLPSAAAPAAQGVLVDCGAYRRCEPWVPAEWAVKVRRLMSFAAVQSWHDSCMPTEGGRSTRPVSRMIPGPASTRSVRRRDWRQEPWEPDAFR
jgi:hypothetical protein